MEAAGCSAHMNELAGLRERRDSAAQNASQHVARVATLEERHRSAPACCRRIESLVVEMRERVHSLRAQIDASAAEKLQRETENQQLLATSWSNSKRNAMPAKLGTACCNSSRSRFGRGWQKSTRRCATARQLLDQARDRRGELSAAAAKLAVRRAIHGGNLPERVGRAAARS